MLLNEEVSWFLESFMPTEIFVLHRLLSILCYRVTKLPPFENVKTKFEIQYSDELQIYVILKLMSNLQCKKSFCVTFVFNAIMMTKTCFRYFTYSDKIDFQLRIVNRG